jgi:hypothetical protein
LLQGKAKKGCIFKSSKVEQNVIKWTWEVIGKRGAQIISWTSNP